jgi:hypothetical protein
MTDDPGHDPARMWALIMLLAVATAAALVLVDRKIKHDIITEARKLGEDARRLGEVIDRVRRPVREPAETAGSSGGPDTDGMVPVDDDPRPPSATVEDGPAGPDEPVDGLGGPPHRGGVNGRRARQRAGELRGALRAVAATGPGRRRLRPG